MIRRELALLTRDPITPEHATHVRQLVLGRARTLVKNPHRYVQRALRRDPHAYLPEPVPRPGHNASADSSAGRERCTVHHQEQPCIGCAADRIARP